jgi:hypothetical protein
MAKVKRSALINFKGTIDGMTIVQSKTYAPHMRKARSTSEINDVLQKSAEAMAEATSYAMSIYRAFDPYRKDVTDSKAWTRLRHLFRKALVDGKPIDYTFLTNFHFRDKVSLDSMASPRLTITQDTGKNMFKLSLCCSINFPEELNMEGVKITIVPVIANVTRKTAEVPGAYEFMEKDLKNAKGIYEAEMALPVKYDAIVIAVKVEGYKDGKSNNQKVNNMAIVEVISPPATTAGTETSWLNDFAM